MRARFLSALLLSVTLSAPQFALAKASGKPATAAPTQAAQPFLPESFAGWQGGKSTVTADASAADSANADVLQEFGFTAMQQETYTRDGNTLTIRAMRFADASGAFGAYSFYRRDGMVAVDAGNGGAFDGAKHILFWQSGIVVDAVFQEITGMSASDLREMAAQLPRLSGGADLPPPMLGNLPAAQLDKNETRYALGQRAYSRGGGVLPDGVIDFHRGEEALTAHYTSGELTLINCPTPQIAMAQLKAIQDYLAKRSAATATQALNDSNPDAIQTRRSGPLVAVTSGNFTKEGAAALIGRVHYDADVTVNDPKGYVPEANKAARLLLGLATLSGVLMVFTIIFGVFFGSGRILFRKLRGKPATTLEENEMIQLNLR